MKTIEFSRSELKQVYENNPVRKAMEHFGVNAAQLYKMLKAAGIPKKRDFDRGENIEYKVVD